MIGDLRHRIKLQRYTETIKSMHGTNKYWETFATVFAEIIPVSGYVTFDTQQIEKKVTHKIRIRNYPNLNSEHWILFGARRFRIRNVSKELEQNKFMILLCEEIETLRDYFEVGVDQVGEPLVQDSSD